MRISISGELAAFLLQVEDEERAYRMLGDGRASYGFQRTDQTDWKDPVFVLCASKETTPHEFWLSLNGFN